MAFLKFFSNFCYKIPRNCRFLRPHSCQYHMKTVCRSKIHELYENWELRVKSNERPGVRFLSLKLTFPHLDLLLKLIFSLRFLSAILLEYFSPVVTMWYWHLSHLSVSITLIYIFIIEENISAEYSNQGQEVVYENC